jgi:hypothetical protein
MPPLRPWHVLLACLALVVPIQAGALEGRGGSGLSVSASLGQCGVSETGILCRIDVSWSGVEHATRYAATVTLADGSVQDQGTVGGGGGSTAVWVPYAGSGTYTVTVTAWGSDPEGKDEKLGDDEAEAVIKDDTDLSKPKEPKDEADADADGQEKQPAEEPAEQPADEGTGENGGPDTPSGDAAPTDEEQAAEPPAEEPAPAPPAPLGDQSSKGTGDAQKAPKDAGAPQASDQKAQTPGE